MMKIKLSIQINKMKKINLIKIFSRPLKKIIFWIKKNINFEINDVQSKKIVLSQKCCNFFS